ncbi:MAG: DUF2232 domain-containing protein [Pseudobdellovibrionaceae bacterium]
MKQELSAKPSFLRFIVVLITATLMSALFTFLGTPLLRVLRNVFGPWKYWLSGFLISTVLVISSPIFLLLGFMILSLWVTVGVYQEFEERGHASFWTACFSIGLGSALLILGPHLWTQALGLNLVDSIKGSLEELARQSMGGKGLSEYGMSSEAIVGQIPSMLIVVQTASLAFALMLDRKFAVLVGLRFEKIASQMRLLEFRVPDFMVWITMLSFLFSFIKMPQAWMSVTALNVFVVMMGLYFFQGLAVLELTFLVFRVGAFARLLLYLFVVGQLFFLLSVVGVIDYWVDFRHRVKRWKLSEKDQNNGENV